MLTQILSQSMKWSIILIWGEKCKKCKFCCRSGHWYNVWQQYKVWLSLPQFLTCQKANKSLYLDDGCNSLKQIAFAIAHVLKMNISRKSNVFKILEWCRSLCLISKIRKVCLWISRVLILESYLISWTRESKFQSDQAKVFVVLCAEVH